MTYNVYFRDSIHGETSENFNNYWEANNFYQQFKDTPTCEMCYIKAVETSCILHIKTTIDGASVNF